MLRYRLSAAAAFAAALFPAFAFSDPETLSIQIGKGDQILNPIILQIDYGKPPEIAQPEGAKWESLEKDSAWTDQAGRHFAYYHTFAVSLGDRKGFGSDYATMDDYGAGGLNYSGGVMFTFPDGDSTWLYSWDKVHLTRFPGDVPDGEPDFISGCPAYGKVILHDGTGSGNLREGQWARLLTRKRERPPSAFKPMVLPGKETLRIQIGKEKQILDTVVIWTQYDAPPVIAGPNGMKWSEVEKDSAWSDAQGWNLRYDHPFLAMMGSRQGAGGDYIHLVDNPEDFSGTPQYTSILSFTFPGDTSESYQWQPDHMADIPKAYPYDKSGFNPGTGGYGEVFRNAGKSGENLAYGQWARLLSREKGWAGYQSASLAHGAKPGDRADRWLIDLSPGATLRTPPGAKVLRILDVQGRIRFESRGLAEGSDVALPEGMSRKALRVQWQADPG